MHTLTTIITLELTAVQALTLCLIASMSDIAKACRITTAGATGLVDALERRQLVKRYPGAHDRRSYIVTITPKARDLTTIILGAQALPCEFCNEPPLTTKERAWMKENFHKKGDTQA